MARACAAGQVLIGDVPADGCMRTDSEVSLMQLNAAALQKQPRVSQGRKKGRFHWPHRSHDISSTTVQLLLRTWDWGTKIDQIICIC